MRILVAHAYHGINYDRVWMTLRDDIPALDRAVVEWVVELRRQLDRDVSIERHRQRDRGPEIGF